MLVTSMLLWFCYRCLPTKQGCCCYLLIFSIVV